MADEVEVSGRRIGISSGDRVVYPDAGITKADVVDHHVRHGHLIVRHAADRPIALRRFPKGLAGEGFFQKNAAPHWPDWIRRVDVDTRGDTLDHPVLTDPADLVWLANQGTIELHPWTATADALDHPVEVLFDLDPPADADVTLVRRATRTVRDVLVDLGATPRVKTSGSKGYHVGVLLDGTADTGTVRELAERVAGIASSRDPDTCTTEWRVEDRRGRVLVDVARNSYGQTFAAAYGLRARPGAPVSAPIRWDELSRIGPADVTITSLPRRLGQVGDVWEGDVAVMAATTLVDRLPDQAGS